MLDTHALLWWVFDSPDLSDGAADTIARADAVLVSAVSAYEITLKHTLGKLPEAGVVARDVGATVAAEGFVMLSVTPEHAEAAGRLPTHHRDPFDRLLAAQALLEDLDLVSVDRHFDPWGVRRTW